MAFKNTNTKGKYMRIVSDQIEKELKDGKTSKTLLGILYSVPAQKLQSWARLCNIENKHHLRKEDLL